MQPHVWVNIRDGQKYPKERKLWESDEDIKIKRKFTPKYVGAVPTYPRTVVDPYTWSICLFSIVPFLPLSLHGEQVPYIGNKD